MRISAKYLWVVFLLLLTACGGRSQTQALPTSLPVHPTQVQDHSGRDEAELATLQSLAQVDEYPLYRMVYYGDFPPMGLVPRFPQTAGSPQAGPWTCSLLAGLADPDSQVYGRNFDWEFSPAVLLFSQPPGRYASVSMVDIAYLGFDGERARNLVDLPLEDLESLLYAPWLPFDGMNEMGLVVGMAAVPAGGMLPDPQKTTIGSLAVMREILDRAADVGQALDILGSYNLDFEGGPPLHYLLADRHGQAALVEFYQGDMHVIPNQEPWHLATNFLVSSVNDPQGVCGRYDTIQEMLTETGGSLQLDQVMDLLAQVSQGNTQWSVAYRMDNGEIQVAMGRDYQQVYRDQLRMEIP